MRKFSAARVQHHHQKSLGRPAWKWCRNEPEIFIALFVLAVVAALFVVAVFAEAWLSDGPEPCDPNDPYQTFCVQEEPAP